MTTPPPSPARLYRAFLRNLRYVPDPHVWGVLVPEMRALLAAGEPGAAKAARELRRVRAAAACHPHALQRLLRYAYGQAGRTRWALVKALTLSSPHDAGVWPDAPRFPPKTGQPLPPPLRPVARAKAAEPKPQRARTLTPRAEAARDAKRAWVREWDALRGVPLAMPAGSTSRTGWEGRGVAESLRALAGLEGPRAQIPLPRRERGDAPPTHNAPVDTRALRTFASLPPSLQAVYPRARRKGHPPDRYERPRPAHTRQNPQTWGPPTVITPRLLTRMYKRLWDEIPWVRQAKTGLWHACKYEEAK